LETPLYPRAFRLDLLSFTGTRRKFEEGIGQVEMTEQSKLFRKETPMFPLGSVLFPGVTLPLNIFEERYRSLAKRCVNNEEPFGVVLIEKGHEVGGGDVRSSVGCLARIIEHREFPDGRWALLIRGESRILVEEWLDDDPYPNAVITDLPDDDCPLSMDRCMEVLKRLTALTVAAKSAGYEMPIIDAEALAVGVDAEELGYRIAHLTPAGSFDRQKILTRSNSAERLDCIEELVVGLEEVLEAMRDKE